MFANNVILGFVLMSVKINKSPTIESNLMRFMQDQMFKTNYGSKRKALHFLRPLFIPTDFFLYYQNPKTNISSVWRDTTQNVKPAER